MEQFHIEKNILIIKHIFHYDIGLLVYKYENNMTLDALNNIFGTVSDMSTWYNKCHTELKYKPSLHDKMKNLQILWASYSGFQHKKHRFRLSNSFIKTP